MQQSSLLPHSYELHEQVWKADANGCIKVELAILDAAGFAQLSGLDEPLTRMLAVISGLSQPGTLQQRWPGVFVARIDVAPHSRLVILVRDTQYPAMQDQIAEMVGSSWYALGLVGDTEIDWRTPSGRLRDHRTANFLLDFARTDWRRLPVIVGKDLAGRLENCGSFVPTSAPDQDCDDAKWFLGPLAVTRHHGVAPDQALRAASPWTQRGFFTDELDGLDLATYQMLRANELPLPEARRAVALLSA